MKKIKKISLYLFVIVAGILLVNQIVHLVWRLVSEYKLSKSKGKEMEIERLVIWRDPGSVSKLNFKWGVGGERAAPKPPFKFLKENMAGSSPSIFVVDARSRHWRVKWGEEVRSETFASRVVWATGYFSEIDYFIPSGRISGARNLQRAEGWVDKNDYFHDARFELDDERIEKRFDEHSWAWNDNPFVGTQELNGLKMLMMFLSNWDNKDLRDVARGSNTAIFLVPKRRKQAEARYMIGDWGASMGKWGENILTRGKWNAQGFFDQSQYFIRGVEKGIVYWGYEGQRTEDVTSNISIQDIQWFYQYIGQITDDQFREGLIACGANEQETTLFVRALRERIHLLRDVTEGKHTAPPLFGMRSPLESVSGAINTRRASTNCIKMLGSPPRPFSVQ